MEYQFEEKYLPMRDEVFTVMFLDKELCEKTLEIVIGEKIELENVIAEYKNDVKKAALSSTFFDVMIQATDGRVFTLDLQRKYLKQRIRNRTVYYACGEVRSQNVPDGRYENLKQVTVTFLLTDAPEEKTKSEGKIGLVYLEDGELYTDVLLIYEINLKRVDERNRRELLILRDFFEITDKEKWDRFISKYGENEYGKKLLEQYTITVREPTILDTLGKEDKYMFRLTEEDKIQLRAEGREEGRIEGRIEGKWETAREMLKMMFPIETIMQITKLSKEEILKLQ